MTVKKLLVVDDSNTIRATVKNFVKTLTIELTEAVDGFSAIQSIREKKPDFILADVMMPRLSGHQLCSLLKNNPEFAGIPLYMLTSKDTSIDKARADLAGADGFIVKPFKKAALVDLLKTHGFQEVAV